MKDPRRQGSGGWRAGGRASACSTAGVTALLSAGVAALLAVAPPTAGSEAAVGMFDPVENASVLEFVSEADRAGLANALEDAGRNWPELAAALEALDGEQRAACLTLIEDMPHLDRLEMTAGTLTEHVSYAFRARDGMPYDVPVEMFGPYILTYRIEEEPAEPWRAELYARFAPVAEREGSVEATARAINAELSDLITEREWGFYGPRQSPLLTLRSGSGTNTEIAVLACAALKAVGIPSRQASVAALGEESGGAHWIEIYDGTDWMPMYPLHPEAFGDFGYPEREHAHNVTVVSSSSAFEQVLVTDRYTDTGTVEFAFVDDGRPAAGFEHFSLSVRNDGALVPLDDLNAVAGDDGRFAADVGDGSYVALAGVRDEAGNPFVMMQEVDIEPGVTVPVTFDVTPRGEAPNPGADDS